MLPVYVSYYFSKHDEHNGFAKRFFSALLIGILASIGFMAVFVFAGFVFAFAGVQLKRYIPYISMGMGIILAIIGTAILFNLKFNFVPAKITNFGDKLKNTKLKGNFGFFVYGVGYAIASLGCTFPIFLMIAVSALSTGSFFDSVLVFVFYAAGMGIVMTIVTVILSTAKSFAVKYLRSVMKYMHKISAVVVVLAGIYIVYYNVSILIR